MAVLVDRFKQLISPKRHLVRIDVPASETYALLNTIMDFSPFEITTVDRQDLHEQARIQSYIERFNSFHSQLLDLVSFLNISYSLDASTYDFNVLNSLDNYISELEVFMDKYGSEVLSFRDHYHNLQREFDVLSTLVSLCNNLSSGSLTLDLVTSSKNTFTVVGHLPTSFIELVRFYINEITSGKYFLWDVPSSVERYSEWSVVICTSMVEYKDRIMNVLSSNHFIVTTVDSSLFSSLEALDKVDISNQYNKVKSQLQLLESEISSLSSKIKEHLLRHLALTQRALVLLHLELEARTKEGQFTIWGWIKKSHIEQLSLILQEKVPSASYSVLSDIPFHYKKHSTVKISMESKEAKEKTEKVTKKVRAPHFHSPPKVRDLPFFPKKGLFARFEVDEKNLRAFVSYIHQLSVVHPTKITSTSEEILNLINEQRKELDSLRTRINQLDNAIDFDFSDNEVREKFQIVDDFEHSKAFINNFLNDYEKQLLTLSSSISKLCTKISQLEFYRPFHSQFVEWGIKSDLFTSGEQTVTKLGSVPKRHAKALKFFCEQVTDYNLLFWTSEVSLDRKRSKNINVLIVTLREYEDAIERVLAEYNFTPIKLEQDLIAEMPSIDEMISNLKRKKDELEEKLNSLIKKARNKFFACKEIIELEESRLKTYEYCYLDEGKVIFWGWIPAEKQQEILNSAQSLSFKVDISFKEETPLKMPSITKTGKTFKAVRGLIEGMGVPSSYEIDPYFFIRFTFPLLFGIMFADLAHGLMLATFGLFLTIRKKKKKVPLDESITGYLYKGAELLIFCGLSSAFFGLLFGSFMGDEEILGELLHSWGITWLPIIHPLKDIRLVLILSLLIGFVIMQFGLFLRFIQNLFYGHGLSARLAPVFTSLYYVHLFTLLYSFIGEGVHWEQLNFTFPVLTPTIKTINAILLLVTLVSMYVFEYLHARGEGLTEALDHMLALISNTLSFSRLLALLLVHAILSTVPYILFNLPALSFGWWIAGLLVSIFLILPLEGLLSFLNSLRLHWVEWFTKFFKGTGIPYKPIKEQLVYLKLSTYAVK